jgi:hypothetical protein
MEKDSKRTIQPHIDVEQSENKSANLIELSSTPKWSSFDIHPAAYLAFRGIPITIENISGRSIFTAPLSDELYRLISAYNQNDPVPIIEYVGVLRSLKARMYASRPRRPEAVHG